MEIKKEPEKLLLLESTSDNHGHTIKDPMAGKNSSDVAPASLLGSHRVV